MATQDFTTTIKLNQTPKEVFDAICNVRGWWSEQIEGGTEKLNDIFDYRYQDVHRCRIQLKEVIPNTKIVWHVLENYFKFTKDKNEWVDTDICFEITTKDGNTQMRFSHKGLVPAYECFDICKNAWTHFIQESLHNLITIGKGMPNSKE